MGAACTEEGDFEFNLVFEEDQQNPPETPGHDRYLGSAPIPPASSNQRAGMHSPPPRRAVVREFSGTYESLPARSVQVSDSCVVECPSIHITTISPETETQRQTSCWDLSPGMWDRERLYLPLLEPYSYRDPCSSSLSPSPASSPSSRGRLSPASSCDSLCVEEEELCLPLSSSSSSSRPASPGGKRRRNSPLASPSTSRRGSYSEDTPGEMGCNHDDCSSQAPVLCELSVPQKTRKTSRDQLSPREVEQEAPPLGMDYLPVPPALVWGRSRATAHSPLFRSGALPPLDWPLPSHFDQYELRIEVQPRSHHRAHYETEGSRGSVKATPTGHPLVKLCGYSEQKPLSLQVFVGTADDRSIRPHPFYQIHRVTGKMVGTASQESVQSGTKVLEINLSPENDMTALIDCAGILKLRNSDIELRKGETDVGRKNTRVRLVFRTHLPLAPPVCAPGRLLPLAPPVCAPGRLLPLAPPVCAPGRVLPLAPPVCAPGRLQPLAPPVCAPGRLLPLAPPVCAPGRVLALQVASVPIECSQRSAQELPVVESLSFSSSSAEGGDELQLRGNNFLSISRVVFMERGTDGKVLWEEEAHVDRDSSSESLLCVLVPSYSDLSVSRPVSVTLFVSNGKRKRSSAQAFNYLPIQFKEPDSLLPPVDALHSSHEDRSLGFHLYPFSHPCSSALYPEEPPEHEAPPTDRAALSERQHSFETLELGFTELLPPLCPGGPPSPSPWLDSPYLSSSPSPSHSSTLSPYPAGSPISTSPQPHLPCSQYPHFQSAYPHEGCPSPPPGHYQDLCPVQYPPPLGYEGWEQGRQPGGDPEGKVQEGPLQHITFEEVSELIGDDLRSYSTHIENLQNSTFSK